MEIDASSSIGCACSRGNRRIWGMAAPHFRHLVGDNPPVPDDDEASRRFLLPDGETREPWPVEPRWKLWKRRELRRSSPEAREFKAKQKAAGGTVRLRGGASKLGQPPRPKDDQDDRQDRNKPKGMEWHLEAIIGPSARAARA